MNAPVSLLVALRASAVASLVSVTAAPGTTCPLLSTTVPETVPVSWAAVSVAAGAAVSVAGGGAVRVAAEAAAGGRGQCRGRGRGRSREEHDDEDAGDHTRHHSSCGYGETRCDTMPLPIKSTNFSVKVNS